MITHVSRVVASLAAAAVLLLAVVGGGSAAASSPAPEAGTEKALPVLAYYYIWYDPSTWRRAKIDTPLGGTYTSDEPTVMRRQIRQAQSAGIDGFLVSWKDSSTLNGRLAKLVEVARELDFKLGIVYQGLDFARLPLPTSKVVTDLKNFASRYADDPVFDLLGGGPLVIVTGTGKFTREQIQEMVAVSPRLRVLASARSAEEYQGIEDLVAGNAYYWGAANPTKNWYAGRLAEMGEVVHQSGGLWIAPAAPGFDARLVGGTSVISRESGQTLRAELAAAVASKPDAIGLISWNEYSENTHVEPSVMYQDEALQVVAEFTGSPAVEAAPLDSSTATARDRPQGLNGLSAMILMVVVLGLVFVITRWRSSADDSGLLPAEPGNNSREPG